MLSTARGRQVISSMLVLTVAMVLASPAVGLSQDGTKKAAEKTTAKKAARAKPRGRLPAHYARVVNSKQREAIYKLQAEFAAKMSELRAQLAKLAEARDEEVEAVLTADQRSQVAKLRDDAKAARDARAKTKAGQSSGSQSSGSQSSKSGESKPIESKPSESNSG